MSKSNIISAVAGAIFGAGSVITAGIIMNHRNQKAIKESSTNTDNGGITVDYSDYEGIANGKYDDAMLNDEG